MTKICCVCQRVEHGTHWKNDYVFAASERVTHGYCPLCFDVVMTELTDSYMADNVFETKQEQRTVSGNHHSSVCV
jgi:hypothetical protein